MTNQHPIRVLLVDDHLIIRTGLRYFLAGIDDIEIVGEASSGAEALKSVAELQPDVVLMDLKLPGMDGITATQQLRQLFPHIRVLVLTSFSGGDTVQQALEAGAVSYLMKDVQGRELVSAIRATYIGRNVLTPEAAEALVTTFNHAPKPGSDLSARELEVLGLLTLGLSNGQIAAAAYQPQHRTASRAKHSRQARRRQSNRGGSTGTSAPARTAHGATGRRSRWIRRLSGRDGQGR